MSEQINRLCSFLEAGAAKLTHRCFGSILRFGGYAECGSCSVAALCREQPHRDADADLLSAAVAGAVYGFSLLPPADEAPGVAHFELLDLEGQRAAEAAEMDRLFGQYSSLSNIHQKVDNEFADYKPAVIPAVGGSWTSGAAGITPSPFVGAGSAKTSTPVAPPAAGELPSFAIRAETALLYDTSRPRLETKYAELPEEFLFEHDPTGPLDRRGLGWKHDRHVVDWTREPSLVEDMPSVANFDAGKNPYDGCSGQHGSTAWYVWNCLEKRKAAAVAQLAGDVVKSAGIRHTKEVNRVVEDCLRDLALFGLVRRFASGPLTLYKIVE